MTEVKSIDKDLIIIWYKDIDINRGTLHNFTKLPNKCEQLKAYVDNLHPKLNGGSPFVQVLLGHKKPFDDISTNMEYYTQYNKAGIFC